jgi:hypothetical protein
MARKTPARKRAVAPRPNILLARIANRLQQNEDLLIDIRRALYAQFKRTAALEVRLDSLFNKLKARPRR